MKNWSLIAKGQGLDLDAPELQRVAAPLDALEEVFRPLVKDLPPDLEPAATFRAEPEAE